MWSSVPPAQWVAGLRFRHDAAKVGTEVEEAAHGPALVTRPGSQKLIAKLGHKVDLNSPILRVVG